MISIIRDMIVKKNRHYTGEEGRREGRKERGGEGKGYRERVPSCVATWTHVTINRRGY